ncbi:MAG TPA: hypothetical protein VEA59_00410, partial [Patescibacteria group bacterium]|nr:hypothetical protein [Patescibacteria group bacterium]
TVPLRDLTPTTKYSFSIFAEFSGPLGVLFQNPTYVFTTTAVEKTTTKDNTYTPSKPASGSKVTDTRTQSELELPIKLPDPENFRYIYSENNQTVLNWTNSTDPRVKNVVLVRSISNFPRNPSEGEIVYRGLEQTFIDTTSAPNTEYYYTVFSEDALGNTSLGVPLKATPIQREVEQAPIDSVATTDNAQAGAINACRSILIPTSIVSLLVLLLWALLRRRIRRQIKILQP